MEENRLLKNYNRRISSYLVNSLKWSTFTGVNGNSLRYVCSDSQEDRTKPALVIISGYNEFIEKYGELLFDLRNSDLTLYTYEHRGQGMSRRFLPDHHKGYVKDFGDYVVDLQLFLDSVVKPETHSKVYFLAHSMGATIATLFLRNNKSYFHGGILSAPMFGINTSPFPERAAVIVSKLALLAGLGENYVLGGKPFRYDLPFENNPLTGSEKRFRLNRGFVHEQKELALGSPTFHWLRQAMNASESVLKDCSEIDLPLLLLQSDDDRVVNNKRQDEFAQKAKNCRVLRIEEGCHEILMERDSLRNQALWAMQDFLRDKGVNILLSGEQGIHN